MFRFPQHCVRQSLPTRRQSVGSRPEGGINATYRNCADGLSRHSSRINVQGIPEGESYRIYYRQPRRVSTLWSLRRPLLFSKKYLNRGFGALSPNSSHIYRKCGPCIEATSPPLDSIRGREGKAQIAKRGERDIRAATIGKNPIAFRVTFIATPESRNL